MLRAPGPEGRSTLAVARGTDPAALPDFRAALYDRLELRGDALFELCDAVLTSGSVLSPVHLSLAPAHRRGWGSLYAALDKGRIDAEALRGVLAGGGFDGDVPEERPAVYAVDTSAWPRCGAETSPQRGYHYHPGRHSAGQPIVAGWAYQLVAGLSFRRDSWVTPVGARRVRPEQDTNDVAAEQARDLIERLPLPSLETPARAPKPRRRSPGRPRGSLSGPARRYPTVKKAA